MHITGRQTYQDNQASVPAIEGGRRLSRKWWIVLVVLAFSAWAFFAAMGLMPLWLWLLILATLISVALGIAVFGPKRVSR